MTYSIVDPWACISFCF